MFILVLQVRHYDSAKLVSATERSWTMWMALMRSFRRLYAYISGDNEDGVRVQMVSPVIIKMENKTTFTKEYTMSFVLPAEHQANAPKPADDDVIIEELTDVTVYVKTFGGWMNGWSINRNVGSLSSCLKSAGAKFNEEYYYVTGYNSPMTTKNRHNEVWFVAVGEPKCSSKN
uniref:Heme-binding protein soul5 n=1 Tax=Sphaeramia orbicularis TaxID=375764 RepID=A0A673BVS8_9TELE